jgi:hypothetical protein
MRQGLDVCLDLLGESVTDLIGSERATKKDVDAIKAIPARVRDVRRPSAQVPRDPGSHPGGCSSHAGRPGVLHRAQAPNSVQGHIQGNAERGCAGQGRSPGHYRELSERALANLVDPAFGTHDDINHVMAAVVFKLRTVAWPTSVDVKSK